MPLGGYRGAGDDQW